MKMWKVIFWTGKDYRTLFIRQPNLNCLIHNLERLITRCNWELTSVNQKY